MLWTPLKTGTRPSRKGRLSDTLCLSKQHTVHTPTSRPLDRGDDLISSLYILFPPCNRRYRGPPPCRDADGDSELEWFKKLVETERERYKRNPVEMSPWLKLTTEDGGSYYYNFETNTQANALPGYRPVAGLEPPNMDEAEYATHTPTHAHTHARTHAHSRTPPSPSLPSDGTNNTRYLPLLIPPLP